MEITTVVQLAYHCGQTLRQYQHRFVTFQLSAKLQKASQLTISYDWNGDGTYDRIELFPPYMTDAAVGFEHWNASSPTNVQGLSYNRFTGGKIRVTLWAALPA